MPRLATYLAVAAMACIGCGGEASVDPGDTAEVPQPPAIDPSTSYVDPLVPPIVLDGPAVVDPGSSGFIRTVDHGNVVDPLNLPIERRPLVAGDFSADDRASFHAHGEEVCASGCAASRHPTPVLTRAEFERQMLDFARGPMDETNDALESLMFHGRQTTAWMDQLGTALSDERESFLRHELERTHALISFRIIDEHGVVRTHMPPTRVPFDRRHVFEMETENLPPLETSGTVKRVGLHHLWTRL